MTNTTERTLILDETHPRNLTRGDLVANRQTGELATFLRETRGFKCLIEHPDDGRELEVWLDEIESARWEDR